MVGTVRAQGTVWDVGTKRSVVFEAVYQIGKGDDPPLLVDCGSLSELVDCELVSFKLQILFAGLRRQDPFHS